LPLLCGIEWRRSQDFGRKLNLEQELEFNLYYIALIVAMIFVIFTADQQESNKSWSPTFSPKTGAGVNFFAVGVKSK